MSDFSFVPLRPFFYAALAKRWKVQFRQGFAYFNNNVDSKRHIIIRTAILCIYMYIYIIQQFSLKYAVFESTLLNFTQTLTKLDFPTLRKVSIEERTQRNK